MYVLSPARSQPTARAAQPAEYEGWPLIAIDYDCWPSNRPARPLQSCAGMPTRAVPSRFASRPLRPIRRTGTCLIWDALCVARASRACVLLAAD
jgi:hypothetical protein